MAKFTKTLEAKANQLAAYPHRKQWDDGIPSILRREIALTVEQIQRLRDQHDEQFHRLLRVECYVDTELLQMEQRQPRYAPYHLPEKDKLRQRLFDIEKERRNLSIRLEDKTQSLEEKLLGLVNRCEILDI